MVNASQPAQRSQGRGATDYNQRATVEVGEQGTTSIAARGFQGYPVSSQHASIPFEYHERPIANTQRLRDPSVNAWINSESRSRLMLDRLTDLVNRLYQLRSRAGTFEVRSHSDSSTSLAPDLRSLDDSVTHLRFAIHDLENRLAFIARRVTNPSTIEHTLEAFRHAPERSLLSRWAHSREMLRPQAARQNSMFDGSNPWFRSHLSRFSENLTEVNNRLDRMSRNLADLQNQNTPDGTMDRSTQLAGAINRLNGTIADAESLLLLPGVQQSSEEYRHSLLERPMMGQEMSPEETELHSRTLSAQSDRLIDPIWAAMYEQDGLLRASRRLLNFESRSLLSRDSATPINDPAAVQTVSDTLRDSNSLEEVTHEHSRLVNVNESTTARTKQRTLSSDTRADADRSPKNPPNQGILTSSADHGRRIHSSHVPLMKEQERTFCDGIEYRNCLGIWLSINGEPAPKHALKDV